MTFKDSYPERVSTFNEDTYEDEESEREYYTVSNIRGVYSRPDYWEREMMVDLTFYLDPLTGTVVWDIPAYEKSLKREEEVPVQGMTFTLQNPPPYEVEVKPSLQERMSNAEPGATVYSRTSGRRFTKKENGAWVSPAGFIEYWPYQFTDEFELEN